MKFFYDHYLFLFIDIFFHNLFTYGKCIIKFSNYSEFTVKINKKIINY